MRHKILYAINNHMNRATLNGGVSELDETFLALSFKGNHKKSGFQIPRQSRKRGKQVKKRGISHEQVCIGTGIDNNGSAIMEMACTGRITGEKLERLFDGYLNAGTIIITDSFGAYDSLATSLRLRHKSIPSGKHTDGGFSLSCVNSLHSRFKNWIGRFNGVSTKYLNNYLVWFKFLEEIKLIKESIKPDRMWAGATAKWVDARIGVIRKREPGWV
jgi:transposase-like protein